MSYDEYEVESEDDLQAELRLARRRIGTFKSNYYKSEKMVAKLETKVKELTTELENTKRELERVKNGGT